MILLFLGNETLGDFVDSISSYGTSLFVYFAIVGNPKLKKRYKSKTRMKQKENKVLKTVSRL